MNKREEKLPRGVFETSPGSNKFGIRIADANGGRPEVVIGTKAEAIKAAKAARNERRRSKVLAPEKPKLSVRQVTDLGIEYAKREHADPSKMTSQIDIFCTKFGDRVAEEISQTEIENWLDELAEMRALSMGTKRAYRTAIRLSYQEAMRFGLIKSDPTEEIKYRRGEIKEVRDITAEEMERIRASIAISGNYRRKPAFCRICLAQFEIAIQTGMRKSEQFNATWEKIDWQRRVLFIPKSKNSNPRDVYLNSYVLEILRALQADQTSDGVLPTGRIFIIQNPRKWFSATLDYAQIKGVTWHSLRHKFATQLVHAKVHIRFVQELMGHIDYESTSRYIHPDEEDVMEGVATISDDSAPEYLINKSYLQELHEGDMDSVALLLSKSPRPRVEPVQESTAPPSTTEFKPPPRMLTRINREVLYELVWTMPMIHAAKVLERSDVALAKACRKLRIPVPGQGYWNKDAAGKPVPQRPPLPPFTNE